MSELLLELFSEEIPARMQQRAAEDLKRLVVDGLKAQGLAVGEARAFATPRRLVLVIDGVPAESPGISEERKGPRVGAPEAAIQGFLKAAGLSSIGEATMVSDAKKGDHYVARIDKPGRPAATIIADVVPDVMRRFPWPKSMRWGSESFTWVRPIHSIIALLDAKVVPFEIAGAKSGNETRGHRFHANEPFAVESFADYQAKLKARKVLLDPKERAERITEQARALAKQNKLELVEDEGLLAENAGLVEWPTVLMGSFDEAFLAVPAECLMLSMKQHQKCFSLRHPRTHKLANRFLLVSNLEAKDGGATIIAGNEKVIRARLSDARFFWEQDLKKPLDEMAASLDRITFHEKLGTQKERVERVAELSYQIAGAVDASPEDARRAAQLAKADLVSGMVGEFPELQGLMGRYYAEAAKTKPEIARAIELHYKPKGPNNTVPRADEGDAVAIAVALADKLDTLVGFWAIGEKPTGSGDPYQLRRAALGVIRIVLENDLRLRTKEVIVDSLFDDLSRIDRERLTTFIQQLKELQTQRSRIDHLAKLSAGLGFRVFVRQSGSLAMFEQGFWRAYNSGAPTDTAELEKTFSALVKELEQLLELSKDPTSARKELRVKALIFADELLAFFADRLKVHLREKGARHDLIDAVFSLPGQDDLALIVRRVEALGEFLKSDDGANLLTGVKRAANILAIEEKKDKRSYAGEYDVKVLDEKEELSLAAAIESVKEDTRKAIDVENFAGAMRALAELRRPVDAFFDKLTVNVPDPNLRENRLRMLSEIRAATLNVADFSKIAG